MTILHIETSTTVCSVAISNHKECVFQKSDFKGMNHALLLSVFIEEGLKIIKEKGLKLDAVAVSAGPGSYTGLRIGVSTAKGLCYGFGIPLIAVDTLKIMWQSVISQSDIDTKAYFCPMIDARRMEVYDEIFDFQGDIMRETTADIIDENSFKGAFSSQKIYFFGNGSDKCKEILASENHVFINEIAPLAANMISLANEAYEKNEFVDLAYYEPFYLKEFQATTPKNKI